jgi:hypothetical protein
VATKADFTEQEWETMQKGVTGAGFLVALADKGFFDTFKEARAMGKHVQEAHEGSQSQLVKELATMRGSGFGLTSSPDEIESETAAALKASLATLAQKAPDEVDAYKQFVLGVTQSVAKAAGDVAASESGAIEKIKAALEEPASQQA